MNVPYVYLGQQFDQIEDYIDDIRKVVQIGDFTLGKAVTEFEERFAELCGMPYAIGVGSGTDALILSLKALGIGFGDEVITTPNTFISTVGAIAMVGARPVFVDNNEEYTIDVDAIEEALTPKTKAILPVHLTGCPADMPQIMDIAKRHKLLVVEDAAQAILAKIDGTHVGKWGETGCFSLHPLKNLNVWGDAGIIVTRSAELCSKLKLFRNHGMINRDEIEFFAHNSRLDSLQAVIGNRLINEVEDITRKRIANAQLYDEGFGDLKEFVAIPPRRPNIQQVYHTYILRVQNRDALLGHLLERGVKAKIHYPIPVHLQKAASYLGYQAGDFPMCEEDCRRIISLPVHQHLSREQIVYVIGCVREFYHHHSDQILKKNAAYHRR